MGVHATRQRELASVVVPGSLFGLGAAALVSLAYLLLTTTSVVIGLLPSRPLEALLLGIPAIGLLYTGYWLHTDHFTPTELWEIGATAVVGTVVAAAITVVGLFLAALGPVSSPQTFFLLIGTGTEGALLGVIAGVFTFTGIFERRGRAPGSEGSRAPTGPPASATDDAAPDGSSAGQRDPSDRATFPDSESPRSDWTNR